MLLYLYPSIRNHAGGGTQDIRRITMNTPIILFLAGLLYMAVLFVWRFRYMKRKHPNTDLLILAWNSFSSPSTNGKEENK